MKWKELTKIFMMILHFKKNVCTSWFIQKYFSALRVKTSAYVKFIECILIAVYVDQGVILSRRHREKRQGFPQALWMTTGTITHTVL